MPTTPKLTSVTPTVSLSGVWLDGVIKTLLGGLVPLSVSLAAHLPIGPAVEVGCLIGSLNALEAFRNQGISLSKTESTSPTALVQTTGNAQYGQSPAQTPAPPSAASVGPADMPLTSQDVVEATGRTIGA